MTLGEGGVIKGGTRVSSASRPATVQLDIPNRLAYKDQPQGDIIKAGDDLSFVIDVRGRRAAD